ncbi:BatA and WFA domain-containing protein [Steroidobacter sp. S1-65]|uniref:BatA and WFA domain-containing protein n=1 Tax=Steroidobacter gossypii TaxID=2805490 RepID=A0ABS1WST8_9GAMM|nr:BatA and WFA domain-containing protein [Steroidobacter gossypii]MBM0104024.1 BatA and WFA domain-containing protein [Steroidobacter gossypii]
MFLAPAFLLGLLAIGVPLWLHRVARANPTQHPFASLMLLEASETQRTAKRTLRYWLLLATRILLLIALVLAFAGPLLTARMVPQPNANAQLHALLVDTSLSMQHGPRWQRALEAAERVIAEAPSSDRLMLLSGSGRRIAVVHESTQAGNAGAVRAALQNLEPGIERLDYGYAMSTANAWLGSPRPKVVLHLISDLQRSAAPLRFADLQLPAQTQLTIHDVSDSTADNVYVADASLQPSDAQSLQARIGNSVTQPQQRDVILLVDDKEVSRKTVTLPPAAAQPELVAGEGGNAPGAGSPLPTTPQPVASSGISFTKVIFSDLNLSAGAHRIEVRLEPADQLPQDDRFFAVVEQADPAALLISRDIEADDSAYFAAAIGSLSAPRLSVEQRDVNSMGPSGIGKFSLVVITDPGALSGAVARRIRSFVEAGGAVLTTLGEQIDKDSPLLGNLNVGEVRNRTGKVGDVTDTHPVLREAADWNRVRFFRQRSIEPAADDKILIALDDGTPLLIERALGAGRMLILTVPVDRRWNDLAIHPLFVHFIGAAAGYLTRAEATAASALVGSTVLTGLTADGGGQIFDPQGRRVLGLAQSTTDRLIPDQAGFYEIRGSEGARWLAVNVDARESDLTTLAPDYVARWQALRVQEQTPAVAASPVPEATPKSLGPWLLWLAALLLLAEVLLANRHLAILREVPK